MDKQERERESLTKKPQLMGRSLPEADTANHDVRAVFGGEGTVPITEDTIRLLVDQHGWPEQGVRDAQSEGALYLVQRNSIIYPDHLGCE